MPPPLRTRTLKSTMTEQTNLPRITVCRGSLTSMLRKYDRMARKNKFQGHSPEAFRRWQAESRRLLYGLLGLDKMESCPPEPTVLEPPVQLPGGICREHWMIRVEPDVWMPFYLLIPAGADRHTRVFLCPPGHNGAGKASVAGDRSSPAVARCIEKYHYDYGLQLAQLGYVAVCTDCRGFGERRESEEDTRRLPEALRGDCYRLAHMGEPLGIPVAGMLTWDLMCAADYLEQLGRWDTDHLSCLGFSGGGMQTLWLAALDQRISLAGISGYFYGYRDALLQLNSNCSCNYVPHLWEYFDMGDLASLIAPRPLLVQSCREDRLNGPRGLANVEEQMEILRQAYDLLGAPGRLIHEICEGPHAWHGEHLQEHLNKLLEE